MNGGVIDLTQLDAEELRGLIANIVMTHAMQSAQQQAQIDIFEFENKRLKELLGGQIVKLVLRAESELQASAQEEQEPSTEPDPSAMVINAPFEKGYQA